MKLRVLLFGIVKEVAGTPHLDVELEEPSVDNLISEIQNKHQELRSLKSMLVAVNNEYATGEKLLNPEDEIAIIPPVAGG